MNGMDLAQAGGSPKFREASFMADDVALDITGTYRHVRLVTTY